MPRPRKPDWQKALEGNPGNRRLRGGERVVITADAKRPRFVTGYAAEIWNAITTAAPGIYRATDSQVLAAFVLAVAQHRTAAEHLEREGHVIVPAPRGKPFRNPWGVVAREAAATIDALGRRLGLDPIARKELQAPPPAPGTSKFGGMIGVTDDE